MPLTRTWSAWPCGPRPPPRGHEMNFKNVCLESIAVALPDEAWTSAEIEERLRPLYERLNLPFGRLELMTGIRSRRVWPAGMHPSAGHAAVCRDMLEPATASFAHRMIGLPPTAQIFDVSNACLGFLNAMTIAAGLIESGQIRCAMIAACEDGRPLVEHTVQTLLGQPMNRNEIKPYFANLTIGSGAVAAIVCHRSLVSGRAHHLLGGVARAATAHSALCQGDALGSEALVMQTDSEQLLIAGVDLARETWADFTAATGWADGASV